MESEWKGRAFFAAIAEALGIGTDQVMAAWKNDEGVFALYSVEQREDYMNTPILQARLAQDADGILVAVGEPVDAGTFRDFVGTASDSVSGGELDWDYG